MPVFYVSITYIMPWILRSFLNLLTFPWKFLRATSLGKEWGQTGRALGLPFSCFHILRAPALLHWVLSKVSLEENALLIRHKVETLWDISFPYSQYFYGGHGGTCGGALHPVLGDRHGSGKVLHKKWFLNVFVGSGEEIMYLPGRGSSMWNVLEARQWRFNFFRKVTRYSIWLKCLVSDEAEEVS